MNKNLIVAIVLLIGLLFSAGCGGGKSKGSNINDTEPPSNVTTFRGSGGDTIINLSWDAATDNIGVGGYTITMTDLIASTDEIMDMGDVTSYEWTGLTNGIDYTFTIVAYDVNRNESVALRTVIDADDGDSVIQPIEPDQEPPLDVTNFNGIGKGDVTMTYVEISLNWDFSTSPDMDDPGATYFLAIKSSGSDTWNFLGDPDGIDIGPIPMETTITVPGDAAGTVTVDSGTYILGGSFAFDVAYIIKIIAQDPSGNRSSGAEIIITPTESQDETPPVPVSNLTADPGNQEVELAWSGVSDAVNYRVYFRTPLVPVDGQDWVLFGAINSSPIMVTGLTNGSLYEFMVAGVDVAGNETVGAATADSSDDDAAKITAIPTSGVILCVPNIRGGVFRKDYFNGRDIVITVSTSQGILTSDDTTAIYYTLDGSEVDTTDTSHTSTQGYFTFNTTTNPDVVQEVVPTYFYAVTIDFDPTTDTYDTGTGAQVDKISDNTLRPNGDADHIVLKMVVKTLADASQVYKETYLIYPNNANEYLKFSGMVERRIACTATYIESGDTAGDVIYIGGGDFFGTLDTAERYRLAFEHFEDILAPAPASLIMNNGRTDHVATLLGDSKTILVTGGYDPLNLVIPSDGNNQSLGLKTYEIFEADSADDGFTGSGWMSASRRFHTVTRLFNGTMVVTGGLNGETNVFGTIGAPETAENLDPSSTMIEEYTGPGGLPALPSLIGNVVEILTGADGSVIQTGVVTDYDYNEFTGNWEIKVQGLVSDVTFGTSYRIINAGTASGESFDATAAPVGPLGNAMNYARYGHSAILLQDGTVFITGGLYDYRNDSDTYFEFTSEIYNPVSGIFELLGNLAYLSSTRFFHNAVLLRDGKVLITGGLTRGDHVYKSSGFKSAAILSTAELYDPFTRSIKNVGAMTKTRFLHESVLLASGKVLICGGYISVTIEGILVYDNSAEIYDPVTETFSATGLMLTPRSECGMALIENQASPIYGQVIIGGGASNTLAELYDESTGLFSATAHGVTGDRFIGTASTVLKDGTVFVSGGQTDTYFKSNNLVAGIFLSSAEIYDTSKVKFTRTVGDMIDPRRHHTATLLQDGTVLVAGGENDDGGLAGAEIYDPDEKTFTQVAGMLSLRYKHTATLLPDGKVFICGGANVEGSLKTCEIYDPVSQLFVTTASMQIGRFDHTATMLPNGWVLITGGESIDDTSVEIYNPVTKAFDTGFTGTLTTGRNGHTAVQPVYAVGKARFTNASTTVVGSAALGLGLESTVWLSSGIRKGDVIICLDDNVPYLIMDITAENQLTLGDNPGFTYDDSGYAGTSTIDKLTGGQAPGEGFEDYVIISQDVYLLGGEVLDNSTEVFDFDDGDDEWPDPVEIFNFPPSDSTFKAGNFLNDGRYGHTLTALADLRLLITGGKYLVDGEFTNIQGTPSDFTDDTWTSANLDSWEWVFHTGFRVSNKMVIIIRGHSAQVFFAE